jgi:hypothetical protein
MRKIRSRDEIDLGPRPLCYYGEPSPLRRPSSFSFAKFDAPPPGTRGTARLYYRLGWTAVVFWNSDMYFTEDILTFDGMIELIRERFGFEKFYLGGPIVRDHELD